MHVATWAIQEQQEVVRRAQVAFAARTSFAPDVLARLVDVVYRALLARLSGGALHEDTVRSVRAEFGPRVAGCAHAIADVLRDRAAQRAGADAEALHDDRREITEALESVLGAFDPEGAASVALEGDDAPRPTLVTAMRELAGRPPASAEQPRVPRIALRMRALTAEAARILRAQVPAVSADGPVAVEPSAHDELLVSTHKEGDDGVTRLLRVANRAALALGEEAAFVASAIVQVDGDVIDAAVRAARILAPGHVALDARSYELVELEVARAPGHERAVDARAPFSTDRLEQSALLLRSTFVGREEDAAQIAQWLLAPTASAGLLVLSGPSGIGKSELVRAALGEAGYDDDDAPIVWGSAEPLAPTPYAALVAMLRALANAPAGHAHAEPRLRALLGALAESLPAAERDELTAASDALATLIGAAEVHDARGARALRLAIRRSLVLVLRALWERAGAARPVVVVVSNADEMDGPTRAVLELAAHDLVGRMRLVLLTSTKPRLAPALESAFAVRRQQVKGLADDAVRELVGQMLGATVNDELAALLERAKGSPLALVHTVRLAVESGWLRPREGVVAVTPSAKEIPNKTERVLASRIERLASEPRKLLSACAFVGNTFTPACAELIGVRLGLARETVVRALTMLAEIGFLVRAERRAARPALAGQRDPSDDVPYGFEHPLMRAAAEAAVPKAEHPIMHALVAEALEAVSVECSATAALLARHHRLAGAPARALEPMLMAARRSARLDDRQGAVALAREGVALAGDAAVAAFPFLVELCVARENVRGHADALRELLACAERTGDPRKRAEALLRVARFDLKQGDPALADAACARALDELRGLGDAELESAVLRVLAVAKQIAGDVPGATLVVAELTARAAGDDHRERASLEHLAGELAIARADPAAALASLLRAVQHARLAADAAAEATSLERLAQLYVRGERSDLALAVLDRARTLTARFGDDHGGVRLSLARAELLLALGDEDAAVAAAEQARAAAKSVADDAGEIAAALVAARAHIARGDAYQAEPLLDALRKRAKADMVRADVAAATARVKVMRARTSAGAPRERLLKTAAQRAQEAIEIVDRLGDAHVAGIASRVGVDAGAHASAASLQARGALADALLLGDDAVAAFPHAQRAAEGLDDAPPGPWMDEALGAYLRVLTALRDDDERSEVLARARALAQRRSARLAPDVRERFFAAPERVELRQPTSSPAAAGSHEEAA